MENKNKTYFNDGYDYGYGGYGRYRGLDGGHSIPHSANDGYGGYGKHGKFGKHNGYDGYYEPKKSRNNISYSFNLSI